MHTSLPMFVHIAILVSMIITAAACVALSPAWLARPLREVAFWLVPFVLLAVLSRLVLSGNGVPKLEWLVPALAVLFIGFFCRSQRAFRVTASLMIMLAVALSVNFLNIVQGNDYTAAPKQRLRILQTKQRAALKQAAESLAGQTPSSGPIGTVEDFTIRAEWHTPLTGIYRFERNEAVLWCPGGPGSAQQVELRRNGSGS